MQACHVRCRSRRPCQKKMVDVGGGNYNCERCTFTTENPTWRYLVSSGVRAAGGSMVCKIISLAAVPWEPHLRHLVDSAPLVGLHSSAQSTLAKVARAAWAGGAGGCTIDTCTQEAWLKLSSMPWWQGRLYLSPCIPPCIAPQASPSQCAIT